MTNDLAQRVDMFFSDVVLGFDATNISSKNVSMYSPDVGSLAESGQTFHRPMPIMTRTVDGRDVSSSYRTMTELTIPSTLTESHLRSVPFRLTGTDLNNPHIMDSIVRGVKNQLSNKVDTLVAEKIADYGTLVVTNTGNIDSYDDAAEADALMLEQQATNGTRCMFLNPRMAKNLAGNLAGRETMTGAPMDAYSRSMLPAIAGFDTYRVDYAKSITAANITNTYLINGGNQDYTPSSKNNSGVPIDNRTQTLAVDSGTGAKAGDCFTIANVFSVGHVNKQSTGQLKTFRIISINSATSWEIAPPIIPANGTDQEQQDYANVNTKPANNAAITFLNTQTKPASVFFEKDAVEIITGVFNIESFSEDGKKIRKAQTDSGLTITMVSDSEIDTLRTNYRMFIWANVEVLNYELAGIMLEGQT